MTDLQASDKRSPIDAQLTKELIELRQRNRLPHALLLSAPYGFALNANTHAIAKSLLCEESVLGGCNSCKACALVGSDTHGDYQRLAPLEGKSSIGVDQVRAACDFIAQTAAYGDLKVLVVEAADKMTTAAANALLKTLEEPQGTSIILLTAQFSWALPATIRSRCQQRILNPPSETELQGYLLEHDASAQSISGLTRDELTQRAAAIEHGIADNFESVSRLVKGLLAQDIKVSTAVAELSQSEAIDVLSSFLRAIEASCRKRSLASEGITLMALLELHGTVGAILRRLRLGSTPAKDTLLYHLCTMVSRVGRGDSDAIADSRRLLGIGA